MAISSGTTLRQRMQTFNRRIPSTITRRSGRWASTVKLLRSILQTGWWWCNGQHGRMPSRQVPYMTSKRHLWVQWLKS